MAETLYEIVVMIGGESTSVFHYRLRNARQAAKDLSELAGVDHTLVYYEGGALIQAYKGGRTWKVAA